jgi:hypothetical protein
MTNKRPKKKDAILHIRTTECRKVSLSRMAKRLKTTTTELVERGIDIVLNEG